MTKTFLAKTFAAKRALDKCRSVDEVKEIRDKAEALRAYAKQADLGLDMQNAAAEVKIRAERRAGEMLKDQIKHGGDRKSKLHDVTLKLKDVGVSKIQSHRWQTIADIPDPQFEELIETTKTKHKELTSALVRKTGVTIKHEQQRKEKQSKRSKLTGERYKVFQADIAKTTVESIDAIITDPPYPKEYLPLYSELAKFALRSLPDGGSLFAMCGQSYLPDIYSMLAEHLTYHWTIAYMTPGPKTRLRQRRLFCAWKPILWFAKGKIKCDKYPCDVVTSDKPDKRHHDWGQSLSGMTALLEAFTNVNDRICDPFCGGGSTGVAAIKTGRSFIGFDIDDDCVSLTAANLEEASK